MNNATSMIVRCLVVVFLCQLSGIAATLEVGPGKSFDTITQANVKANDGDTILVYPLKNNQSYQKVAIFVKRKNLTFKAVPDKGNQWVKLSGQGFNYSGRGSTPRAIFQFNKGADHCTLEGFELFEAHNKSNNGAGVRINQANHVTIRQCHIHHNDMGIMSNGNNTLKAGVNQKIEQCLIHHNGSFKHPGYNHNLYLGGSSVTVRFCEIHSSLTGHNVKSRAHHTRVEYSYIHHSANREFDLVDSVDTQRPHSDAVLMGNIIVKNPKCKGNRGVIHFGQDGGREHEGTIHLIHNTIVTPFISPVLDLSAEKTKAILTGNFIGDGGVKQNNQQIASARHGASLTHLAGSFNWFDRGFARPNNSALTKNNNTFGQHTGSPFVNVAKQDYRPARRFPTGLPASKMTVPLVPGMTKSEVQLPLAWQYKHPADKEKRSAQTRATLGAYAYQR